MSVKWTEEQQKVIDLRDRNILVSAAAGSGKTAVLVERIISRITDENDPADRPSPGCDLYGSSGGRDERTNRCSN